jgi:hypothetical protein
MSTPIAIEVNCATGEVVERELTQAEQDAARRRRGCRRYCGG